MRELLIEKYKKPEVDYISINGTLFEIRSTKVKAKIRKIKIPFEVEIADVYNSTSNVIKRELKKQLIKETKCQIQK